MNETLDFPLEPLDAEYYLPVEILGMTTLQMQDCAGNLLYFDFYGGENIALWNYGQAIKVKVSRVISHFLWMIDYGDEKYLWASHPCIKLPPQPGIDLNEACHEAAKALEAFYKRPQSEINEIVLTNPFGFKGYIRRRKDMYPELNTAEDFNHLTWEDHYGKYVNEND